MLVKLITGTEYSGKALSTFHWREAFWTPSKGQGADMDSGGSCAGFSRKFHSCYFVSVLKLETFEFASSRSPNAIN